MRVIGVNLIANHADYRLMSKKALPKLSADFRESNLFLRGIVPTIGLKSTVVEYNRQKAFCRAK